jgi:hypothetical protein
MQEITKEASGEAQKENRHETEMTLWNFVNAITQKAKSSKTIDGRVELEGVGYATLVRYGAVLASKEGAPLVAGTLN